MAFPAVHGVRAGLPEGSGRAAGLSWRIGGRIVPVLADLALILLVGRLAGERHRQRAFQYGCAPVGVMVSAIHGQFGPLSLLFGVAALLAARVAAPTWRASLRDWR